MPNQDRSKDLPMELASYEEFLKGVRRLKTATPDLKRKVVEDLVHKIEVKPDGFVIHYHVGKNQTQRGLEKSSSLLIRSQKFFPISSSNSLTYGDHGKN